MQLYSRQRKQLMKAAAYTLNTFHILFLEILDSKINLNEKSLTLNNHFFSVSNRTIVPGAE